MNPLIACFFGHIDETNGQICQYTSIGNGEEKKQPFNKRGREGAQAVHLPFNILDYKTKGKTCCSEKHCRYPWLRKLQLTYCRGTIQQTLKEITLYKYCRKLELKLHWGQINQLFKLATGSAQTIEQLGGITVSSQRGVFIISHCFSR